MRQSRRTPIKERYSNGWLSPQGQYYPVRPQGHVIAADAIVGKKKLPTLKYRGFPINTVNTDSERTLEKANWAKVSDNKWFSGTDGAKPLTQKQIDFIFDWCSLNKHKYPPPYVDSIIEDMKAGYF